MNTLSRVSVTVKMSPDLRDFLRQLADSRGETVTDVIIRLATEEQKFHSFATTPTRRSKAEADWNQLAAEAARQQ